jgi:signal transduction histidine kinase
MKFTQEGSVLVRVLPWETRGLRFEVIDTGDGLSDEASAKMFMPFIETPHDKANYQGGTGLGLYICKLLSDLMVRNILGSFSCFPCKGVVRPRSVFSLGASVKVFMLFWRPP